MADVDLGQIGKFKKSHPNWDQRNNETEWLSPDEFLLEGEPQLYENGIQPTDLKQSTLIGDCWLIASFASAANYPELIENLFVINDDEDGRYRIQIYNPIKEEWEVEEISDKIPCITVRGGTWTPRFIKPIGNELWAMLLEKAFAKRMGSYRNLISGSPLYGFACLTGLPVYQLRKDHYDASCWKKSSVTNFTENGKRFHLQNCDMVEKKHEEDVWELLQRVRLGGVLMAASINKSSDKQDNDHVKNKGLMAGHAFSVLRAVQVVSEDATTIKLVNIRNPYAGKREWHGQWCDDCTNWHKYPEIARICNHTYCEKHSDGIFWMSLQDFFDEFDKLQVCETGYSNYNHGNNNWQDDDDDVDVLSIVDHVTDNNSKVTQETNDNDDDDPPSTTTTGHSPAATNYDNDDSEICCGLCCCSWPTLW